jgi:hypothetical protein
MKWCPFARLDGDARNQEIVGGVNHPAAFCIASACMAWRGQETAIFKKMADAEFKASGVRLTPHSGEIEGYCGLAGQP